MSVDTSQLKGFSEKLKTLNGAEKEQFIIDACNDVGNQILAKAIKNTDERIYQTDEPKGYKRTGNLFRSWAMKSAEKVGDTYRAEVFNDARSETGEPYPVYLEYGHRTPNHKGWVEGKFMLTDAVLDVVHKDNPELREKLKKKVRGIFNGGNRN